jgi:hypothetical protein
MMAVETAPNFGSNKSDLKLVKRKPADSVLPATKPAR